jgi:hypothetical protein
MRCLTRHSILWIVLAAHFVAFEWGPGLHRWQCGASSSSTVASDGSRCCGARDACDPSSVELQEPQSEDPAPDHEHHDPRHCSVCKFFAHSQALPVAIAYVVKVEAGQEFHAPRLPLVVQPIDGGYLARGPPCWS